MAVGARDAALDAEPLLLADVAGAALVPVLPGVRARAELLAGVVAAQHRPGGQVDHRQAGGERAHDQAGRGLVAAAHQHHAVDRVRADLLLGLDREEVAVEHRRRLHEALGERDRRHLDREAAGLEHAALHVLDPLLEVHVAGVEVGPGVEDADDRLAHVVGGAVAHLHDARAVAEAAEVVGCEPAGGAELLGGLLVGAVEHGCPQTGVSSGWPAKCAARLSTTSWDMAARVSTVPLEWCGIEDDVLAARRARGRRSARSSRRRDRRRGSCRPSSAAISAGSSTTLPRDMLTSQPFGPERLELGPADQAAGRLAAGDGQHQNVRAPSELDEVGDVVEGHVLLVPAGIGDAHLEGARPVGDLAADPAEADDADGLAGERGRQVHHALAAPVAGLHVGEALRHLAKASDDEAEAEVGDVVVEDVGRVGHRHAARPAGGDVDLVDADAGRSRRARGSEAWRAGRR